MKEEELKPFTVERPWGAFRQFTHDSPSTVKIHKIKPNGKTSLQSHSLRSEFWHIIDGSGIVQIEDKKIEVKEGDEFETKAGMKHRWIGGKEGMMILEITSGKFDENDITRYEDEYGRA
jgi:mannose-6-phosphate isomerase-like protein (cupin superfamily)